MDCKGFLEEGKEGERERSLALAPGQLPTTQNAVLALAEAPLTDFTRTLEPYGLLGERREVEDRNCSISISRQA